MSECRITNIPISRSFESLCLGGFANFGFRVAALLLLAVSAAAANHLVMNHSAHFLEAAVHLLVFFQPFGASTEVGQI